jgi:hypothetical protein
MADQKDLFAPEPPQEPWSLYQHAKPPAAPAEPERDPRAREQALLEALAKSKEQLRQLRARIVRADSVAYVWTKVPAHPGEAECGALIRQILGVDDDCSLNTARAEWSRLRA